MTQKQLLFMKLIEEDNKSDLAKYFIVWDEAQKELLEELYNKYKEGYDINDQFLKKELKKLESKE